jgi:hypothetical protein
MKAELRALVKVDLMPVHQIQPMVGADRCEQLLHLIKRNGVGRFAKQAQENCAVGPVPVAGQSERSVEIDCDRSNVVEKMLCIELPEEAKRRAHWADGMRAGGTDADLEEFKETGIHPSAIVGVCGDG